MADEANGGEAQKDGEVDVRQKCEMYIHAASVAAGAAAAGSVVPGADSVAIMPIQIAMIAAVAREYGVELSGSLVKSTMYASFGSVMGRAGSGLLLRWTPIAGNVVRAGVAFSVTEALGRLVLERLEAGENLI